MKLILLKDVKDLGRAGDLVNAAEGYARNFLLPRKLAIEADKGALKNYEQRKEAIQKKNERVLADAKNIATKLSESVVTIEEKVGSGTKLYGSVTSQEIADAVKSQLGITIDKRDIHMDEHIKSTGTYNVPVKLHHNISASINVNVIGKSE